MNTREVIFVAGPSAAGKTAALNILREQAQSWNIAFEWKPFSDSHTIYERMVEDDYSGGQNHYHEWCPNASYHTHEDDMLQPRMPFTLAGNAVAHAMGVDFFNWIADFPPDDRLHFAEWSGGKNTNSRSDRAHETDLSFRRQAHRLRQGELNTYGLTRVATVIHPVVSDKKRLELNRRRFGQLPTLQEQELGTRSWPLGDTGMRIFGEDDFRHVQPVLESYGIRVVHVENDGGGSLQQELERIAPALFGPWMHGVKSKW